MFRPERMSLAVVMALESQVELITAAIARAGIMHLVDAPKIPEFSAARPRGRSRLLLERANNLEFRTREIAGRLTTPGAKRPRVSLSLGAAGFMDRVDRELSNIERQVDMAEKQIVRAREEVARYQEISSLLEVVGGGPVTVEDIRGGVFDKVIMGFVNEDDIPQLSTALENIPCAYATGWAGKTRRAVCVATSEKRADEVIRGAASAGFVRASIPDDLTGPIIDVHEEIEVRVWAAREDEAESRATLKELSTTRGQELSQWIVELHALGKIEEASLNFGSTGTVEVIAGWVPCERMAMLRKLVDSVSGNKGTVSEINDPTVCESMEPPTSLKNPPFVRAFESLVSLYGTPPYDGIDPTPFVALSFTLMFGVMFADLGHGIVLGLVGLGAFYFFRSFSSAGRDMGEVIGYCGLSSAVFGILFGSVFGVEGEIIPGVLLLHPMAQVQPTLMLGLGIGVFMLTAGIVLNITQQLFRRRWQDALIGEWGLASLIFYLGLIGALVWSVSTPGVTTDDLVTLLVVLLLPTFLLTAFRGPIGHIVRRLRKKTQNEHATGGHHDEDGISIFIGTLISILEMVTNTCSHIRVAAFALNHAALCTAVFLIADILREAQVGEPAPFLLIALGNVLIIIMEGLVVFMQTMRLHFYEFFSKFFLHMGVPYRPFRIE